MKNEVKALIKEIASLLIERVEYYESCGIEPDRINSILLKGDTVESKAFILLAKAKIILKKHRKCKK